jgi:nucleoside-diphosphate-sugar epimerase
MRILVTGGLGFIGSNFIQYFLETTNHEVINVDKCDYMARECNVPENSRYRYIRGDITEHYHMRHIFREHQPDVVIHFAAQSCVTKSFDLSFQYTKDNVLGTHVLLETAREYGKLSRFIHISTDEVYGEVGPLDTCGEKALLNPSNPYSASKAAAELYVTAYTNAYKLPCIITRGNNVFGPQQYPEKVIPLFITQILDENSATIHGDGMTRRNFVHVDDVSRAVALILEKGEVGKTYNIGSSHEYSVLEIYEKIKTFMGKGTAKFVEDPRPFNDSRYCIDSSQLRSLGWSEDPNFDLKLKETIQWYTDHPGWYN